MNKLTTESTREEILEALNSIGFNDKEIEDQVDNDDLNISMIKYKKIDGYFYNDNYNLYWIESPYDFEIDEDSNMSLPNAIWLKNI